MTASHRSAMAGLIVGCIIFGLGSLIVAAVPVGAYAIAFWRLAVAAVIFYVLIKWRRQRLPASRRTRGFALLSGAFLGVDLALWHESIYAIGPGIATLLNSLQIFFLAAIGLIWFGERQSRMQLLSLLLAVGGVALIASPELSRNQAAGWGLFCGVVSGAMLAASMTFIRKTHAVETAPLLPLMLLLSLGGMLAMLVPMLWLDAGRLYPQTWRDTGLILVYGAVMQCLAWGLITYSIPKLSLALTGLLLLSEPVAALFIDAWILGKTVDGWQWAGVALTLLAIYLGSTRGRPEHTDTNAG